MAKGCKGSRNDWLQAILGVLLPPLRMYLNREKCDLNQIIVLICFIPFIFLWFLSVILQFHFIDKMDLCQNICCMFIPPLGVYLGQKKCGLDVLIALILMFFLLLPGVIFAYARS